VPHTPALRMSQANALTRALTAQILRARGLLPPAEEPPAPPPLGPLTLADWAATRARARALRAEVADLIAQNAALCRESARLVRPPPPASEVAAAGVRPLHAPARWPDRPALEDEEDLAGAGVPAGGPSYRALAAALIAIPMSDNFGLLVDVLQGVAALLGAGV
jgi:hypothetical protein